LGGASTALISAAKIEAIEFTINAASTLRRNVGAYGLMADGPFGATNEILLCARFAEGDSRILQQTLVRDLLRAHRTPAAIARLVAQYILGCARRVLGVGSTLHDVSLTRMWLLLKLLWFLRTATRASQRASTQPRTRGGTRDGTAAKSALSRAWLRAGDLVYDLAKAYAHELITHAVLTHFGPSANLERFALAAVSETRCELCQQY